MTNNNLEKIISNIRDNIFECKIDDEYFGDAISYKSNGTQQIVCFFGFPLWDSENDEREYDDEKDDYEPLESFLRKKIMDVIAEISKIKV